jgi:cytochrome c-type biogenesis protein CcmH
VIAKWSPLRALLIALMLACGGIVQAKDAVPTEVDPVAQKRAVGLANELRCLVCQNQTIADSHAELAVDLRRQIDEQIKAGKSDGEIIDYMVARYGDFVLYRPPLKATTVLLWGGPALLGLVGIFVLWRVLRARRAREEDRPLTDEERREAGRLLAEARAKEAS